MGAGDVGNTERLRDGFNQALDFNIQTARIWPLVPQLMCVKGVVRVPPPTVRKGLSTQKAWKAESGGDSWFFPFSWVQVVLCGGRGVWCEGVCGAGSDLSWLQAVSMVLCALLSCGNPAVTIALDVRDKEPGGPWATLRGMQTEACGVGQEAGRKDSS